MPPAATIRTGVIATGGANALNTDQLVVDMMEQVFQYDPPGSPLLTVVTKRMQTKRAKQTTVKHLEDQPVPEWDKANGTVNAAATALVVDHPTYHRVGDLLKVVSTGETIRVVGVNPATSTLTISRSWGAVAAAQITDNDDLLNMGAAEMEGDDPSEAKSTLTVTKTNFAQIVKEAVELSKTAQVADSYLGDQRMYDRRKAGAKHAREWEQIFLHGEKNEDTSTGSRPIRSCGGLDEHIVTNVLDANGTLTEPEFIDWIGDCMRHSVSGGRKRKGLLMSRELASTISMWGNNKLVTNSQASATYGFDVATYISPHGTLDCALHPLLEVGYAGTGYIVDWAGVWYRPYRRTELHTNIETPGADRHKDEYVTEASASFALEECFGKVHSVEF